MMRKKLPIGIQTFREMREENHYYVDKTAIACQYLAVLFQANESSLRNKEGSDLSISVFLRGTANPILEGSVEGINLPISQKQPHLSQR